MRRSGRTATIAISVLAMVGALLASAQVARSQSGDPGPAEGTSDPVAAPFEATPAEGPTGTPIEVSGADCLVPGGELPGDAVVVTLAADGESPVATATIAVQADGTWAGAIAAPLGTPAGELAVGARCIAPELELVSYDAVPFVVTGEGAEVPGATTQDEIGGSTGTEGALAGQATAPTAEPSTPGPVPGAADGAAAEGATAAGEAEGTNAPATPSFGASIEPYPSYDPQTTCSPTAKPGTLALQQLVTQTYPNTGLGSISRSCNVGGTSEHKEGRAWDWTANVSSSGQRASVENMLSWLLATDQHGNRHAMARRLGVMYIIWNRQMFRMYAPERGWQPYSGSSPHTDHVHISLTRAGGNKATSFWSGASAAPLVSYTSQHLDVDQQFTPPLAGDFDGDGAGDVLWYAPGEAADFLWWGDGDRTFTGAFTAINGTYRPEVVDLNGDGRDDVLWYAPGPASDFVWYGRSDRTFDSVFYRVNGSYTAVLPGDFDGDGREDVFWYGAGGAFDVIWYGSATRSFRSAGANVVGTYDPLVGDFDGDGRHDIFWYGPGSGSDYSWWGGPNGFTGLKIVVSGTYQRSPVGDLNGDGTDDLIWYGPGPAKDNFWLGQTNRTMRHQPVTVNGTYTPITADFDGNGSEDVLWYGAGTITDSIWWTR